MNKTLIGIILGLFLTSLGYGIFLKNFTIPKLERTIIEYKNTPPKIITEYLPGKIDTVLLMDTLIVRVPTTTPPKLIDPAEPLAKSYETTFEDTLIRGTIYNTIIGEGFLDIARLEYKVTNALYSQIRVDTLKILETRTITEYRPSPRPLRVQAGLFVGASPAMDLYMGPTIGVLTPKDVWLGYSYDVLNDAHLVSYRSTIRFDFLKKIKLTPW